MTKPTWATILGVLMVLIGGCGGTNDLKLTKTMKLLDFKEEIMVEIDKNVDIKLDSSNIEVFKTVTDIDSFELNDTIIAGKTLADSFNELTQIPPSAAKKLIMHGYLGLPISLLYILSGISLLKFRKYVIPFVLTTIGITLAFAIYQYFDIRGTGLSPIFQAGLNFQATIGVLFDIIFLVVILVSNKDYYTQTENEIEDYYDTV